MMVSTDKSF